MNDQFCLAAGGGRHIGYCTTFEYLLIIRRPLENERAIFRRWSSNGRSSAVEWKSNLSCSNRLRRGHREVLNIPIILITNASARSRRSSLVLRAGGRLDVCGQMRMHRSSKVFYVPRCYPGPVGELYSRASCVTTVHANL